MEEKNDELRALHVATSRRAMKRAVWNWEMPRWLAWLIFIVIIVRILIEVLN